MARGQSTECVDLNPMKVLDNVIDEGLLDATSAFLLALRESATTGKVIGKTLLDPKRDSKWDRGRTHQAMHFGAHVRGGKAVGAEVEDIPSCVLDIVALLKQMGLLASPRRNGHEGGALSNRLPVTAVTVDFFRKGSYAPALAATAPLPPYAGEAAGSMRMEHDRLGRVIRRGSDTEAEVCMLWLQAVGDVVIGSSQELAQCSKGAENAAVRETASEQSLDDGEGVFAGIDRLSAGKGSVMVWDGSKLEGTGVQVAVPNGASDRILLTFQTLTPEASSHVLRNRAERQEARARAGRIRRAAKEAKEAKSKMPIPGTPVVVENWRARGDDDGGEGACEKQGGCARTDTGHDEGDDDGRTPPIEREHVRAVYDTIAPHWSHTRYKPWPKVEKFLSELEACSLVADAGCGNGKYLGCDAAGGFLLGSDASVNLLHVCKERLPEAEVLGCDCLRLPYRSGIFDAAISIAVLHHFSSKARRLRALSDLCRILKPGGQVLVYAWAIEQEQDSRRSFATQDVLVPWHLADHHSKEPHSNGEGGDGCGQRTEPSDGMANAAAEVAQGPMSASSRGSNGLLTSFREDTTTPESVSSTTNTSYSGRRESWGAGQKPAIGCGIEAEGSPPHEEPGNTCTTDKSAKDISPPTPDVPKHGVRLDGVAGASGSVVYQRYCHVYAEGELEELVKQVHGLRLVESYYDRSNWCIVAQKEGKQGR